METQDPKLLGESIDIRNLDEREKLSYKNLKKMIDLMIENEKLAREEVSYTNFIINLVNIKLEEQMNEYRSAAEKLGQSKIIVLIAHERIKERIKLLVYLRDAYTNKASCTFRRFIRALNNIQSRING